ATDNKAQEATRMFFVRPADWVDFIPRERYYAALPYLHAESPEKQRQVNPVIHYCAGEMESLSFMGRIADLYLETIQIFGRFPHRNALLGRQTTAAEAEFLEREWHPRRRREP
ncbi:MAG: DUF924 domain-containing protein, partial [Deltaproteobacteria bacterium]|nr:DUF924 domain-containing protein [Deltaproteobacteria bacterium]